MLGEPREQPLERIESSGSRPPLRPAWARRAISPLLALVLHAVIAVVVWRLPARLAPEATLTRSEELAIEIVSITEVSPASPEAPPQAGRPPEGPKPEARPLEGPRGATAPSNESVARASATSREIAAAATGETSATDATERGPTGTIGDNPSPEAKAVAEGPSFVPREGPTDIGIGGVNRFLPKSEHEVEAAVATRERGNLLRHTGWERDRSLGLGPEGPVLTALSDATSQSIAPVRGRAIFVATTNAAGEVESLELLDAEGGRPGWADARRLAVAALVGKKLRVPSSAKRVQMKIEVVSAWKLPSGQDPGTDVTLFHIPIAKGEGKDSGKVSILDPIPKVRIDYLEVGPGVKIPVPSIQLEIFGATTDPSNLGAKPRRIIHTHLVDSTVM
jgi:hypothetical protein